MQNREYIAAVKWFYDLEDQEAENKYMWISRRVLNEILISYLEYNR